MIPAGFHEQADGSLVCPHRDLSVCPPCAAADEAIVDVVGAHFYIPDPADRAVLDPTERAAVLLAEETRGYGVSTVAALHDVIDANEAVAAALEAVGFDVLDHAAANAVTARADEMLAS